MVLGQFEEHKAKWGDELTVIGGDAEVVAADMLKLCPVSAVELNPLDAANANTATPGLPSRPTHSEPTLSEAAILAQNIYTATKQALSSGDATAARVLYDQFIARVGSLRGAFASGTLTSSR